jgi:hypothetical protein
MFWFSFSIFLFHFTIKVMRRSSKSDFSFSFSASVWSRLAVALNVGWILLNLQRSRAARFRHHFFRFDYYGLGS